MTDVHQRTGSIQGGFSMPTPGQHFGPNNRGNERIPCLRALVEQINGTLRQSVVQKKNQRAAVKDQRLALHCLGRHGSALPVLT